MGTVSEMISLSHVGSKLNLSLFACMQVNIQKKPVFCELLVKLFLLCL